MRNRAVRTIGGLLTTIFSVLSVVACSGGLSLRRATPTPAPVTLRLGTLPFLASSVFQVGVDQGYFAAQGIAVELVPFRASADMLAPLATGDIDAGIMTPLAGLFNAVASGSAARVVFAAGVHTAGHCCTGGFLVRKEDAESGKYSSPADWKGARLMVSSGALQGTGGYALAEALRPYGLSAADLVTEKADPPVQAEALRAGRADIVFAAEPWVTQLQADGDISLILTAESLIPGIPGTVVVAGERLLGNHEACARFALAYMQALRQFALGGTEANLAAAAKCTGLDTELLGKICWSWLPTNGRVDAEALARFQEWYKSTGLVDRVLSAEEYVDTSYVDEAVRILDGSSR
jgi:ABC-type nitrate/sulfonate/bicarbonate transport system substrate-binding protein